MQSVTSKEELSIDDIARRSHFFSYNEKKFLVLKGTRQSFECSEELYRYGMELTRRIPRGIIGEIATLIDTQYMSPDTELIRSLRHTGEPGMISSLSLGLVNDCNLACTYCSVGPSGSYNSGRPVSMHKCTAERAVDFLVANSRDEELELIFFGGEPLLNKGVITHVVNYIEDHYVERKWHFQLVTNGVLIDGAFAGFLSRHGFTVLVTLSGPPLIHNSSRVTRDKKGSWDDVYRGLCLLKQNGVDFIIKAVVTGEHSDKVEEIREYLAGLGLTDEARIIVNFEHGYFWKNSREFFSKDREITGRYLKTIMNGAKRPSYFSNKDLEVLLGEWGPESGCDAGKSGFYVDPSGTLHTCHVTAASPSGRDKYKAGNVYSGLDREKCIKIKDAFEGRKEECNRCWASGLCSKGCNLYWASAEKLPAMLCDNLRLFQEATIYHCSFFDWDHVSRFCSRYTNSYNLDTFRQAFFIREELRSRLKHVRPVHAFPAVTTVPVKKAQSLICR